MPFIKQEKRRVLDPVIDELRQRLVGLDLDDPDSNNTEGNITYIFFKLLILIYGDMWSTNFKLIKDAMGVLACTQAEFYRKVAAPYEDQKEFDNGGIVSDIDPTVVKEVVVKKKD